ncbi:MAG TPA: dihydrolipoamide acetyltransferase family protein [Ktedonobacteraceae bacterium]|nr:dihydrolipoamide acetyltransferase family protein [Ktedonobacteraceae bacterium]
MKTVEMPKMGDTMEEGKILQWIKHEGDAVKKGESLAEVETDKVNIEIEAFATGILRKILIAEGESAPIGAPIAYIGAADEPLPGGAAGNDGNGKAAQGPAKKGQGKAPASNSAAPISAAPTAVATAPAVASLVLPPAEPGGRVFISPLARRLAEEHNIDYRQLRGTGPNGRIIKLDIESALKQGAPTAAAPAVSAPAFTLEPQPASIDAGEVVEIPLSNMRRTIAKRLAQSMQAAPHFYVTSVIDTGKLGELRAQINAYAMTDPNPVKVSFNDLIIKAVAIALGRMPQVNVSFAEDKLIQKKRVHIGVAVALEQGLIVPVLHNADTLGILDIAREAKRLAEAARTNKLRPDDLSGGTFSVSNLGSFGVDSFTAIINPPESAILAVGMITPTPAVVDGQVVVRERMKVTLSSDHRALDGAVAARFLQEVKRLLEEPFGLLL